MKLISLALATALLPMITISCGHAHSDHEGEHDHADGDVHTEEQKAHEEGLIVMSPEDASYLGVHADTIKPSTFGDILHVPGQLESAPTDVYTASSPSAGIVTLARSITTGSAVGADARVATVSARNMAGGDPNENAYVALENAKRELDRLTPLHADGIVSTRDYNAAVAEYNRAKAACSGIRSGSSINSRIAGIVTDIMVKDGQYVDAGTPVAVITKGERLTVRADVPARYYSMLSDKITGNIKFAGNDKVYSLGSLNARRTGVKSVSMTGAFVPVYFEIDNVGGNLVAGMVADIYLAGVQEDDVMSVPVGAVSEQQGVYFVYEKLDDDCYRKVPVTLGRNDGERIEIVGGIESGAVIVTDGMTFVKLAESNGAVPEGHTHNH